MGSFFKKKEAINPENYTSSGRSNRISDKHYRPYHYRLQKEEHLFDNDWMDYYAYDDDDDDDDDYGINKRKWRAHDTDGFDDLKDDR